MDGGTATVVAGLAAVGGAIVTALIGKRGSTDSSQQTATGDYRKQRRVDRQPAYEEFATNVRAFAAQVIDKSNEYKRATASGADQIPQPRTSDFLDMGDVFADSAIKVRLLGPQEVADAVEEVLQACVNSLAMLSGYANLVHSFPGFPVDEMTLMHEGQFHTYREVTQASQMLQISIGNFLDIARAHMDDWEGEPI
ncbi:hypothetical protein [Actinacidiphila oryziradicis]|uniref:Uncharacterized protein n=1 Tax=Actinacidiphila oryziradicis TaxID=2571141 RepID=A0A4U0RQR4_9ACTN|nr:hypothetical protein [Actinacidiphila oryziradicis]TJZ97130.1 hypothetical protein FCI23_49890 [Actinacidiphila oryziradicis]